MLNCSLIYYGVFIGNLVSLFLLIQNHDEMGRCEISELFIHSSTIGTFTFCLYFLSTLPTTIVV